SIKNFEVKTIHGSKMDGIYL
nr:SREBP cleavage activity, SCA=sterol regulatory element-binding protein cleavage protease/interleukin-1 beta converting enzyme-related cysteine protease {N-terminal} [hamsters, liver, Peptide Partial, 20 aa] [Cricetinae]